MNEDKEVEGDGRTAMERALSNDLVAERILSQVEFKDKKNIRILNRFWRDSTLAEWRKLAALRINISNEVQQDNQGQGFEMLAWNDFEGIMEDPEWSDLAPFRIHEKPFRRFILFGDMWLPLEWENAKWVKAAEVDPVVQSRLAQFLNEYGPTLQYLRLEGVTFAPGCFLLGLKWLLQKACPQLRGLSLNVRKLVNPSKIDHRNSNLVSYLEMALSRLQISAEEVASNLTHLEIFIENDSSYLGLYALNGNGYRNHLNVNKILRLVPDLKVLNLRVPERHYLNCIWKPMIGAEIFRDLFEKEKCSALEEVGLLVFQKRYWGVNDNQSMGIEELNRYIEEVNPSLKRIQIVVDFDERMNENKRIEGPYPHFHEFCIQNGHLLTELTINVKKRHGVACKAHGVLYAEPDDSDSSKKNDYILKNVYILATVGKNGSTA